MFRQYKKTSYISMILASFLSLTSSVLAQDEVASELVESEGATTLRKYVEPQKDLDPIEFNSLFFTKEEYSLLQEAVEAFRQGGLEAGQLSGALAEMTQTKEIKRQGPRDIALGGLVFVSSDDWTVWLNKKRITPDSLPEEVLDLKVSKEYVELEWFDVDTNQIFPLRLRPHQRFNLDAKIFLP